MEILSDVRIYTNTTGIIGAQGRCSEEEIEDVWISFRSLVFYIFVVKLFFSIRPYWFTLYVKEYRCSSLNF